MRDLRRWVAAAFSVLSALLLTSLAATQAGCSHHIESLSQRVAKGQPVRIAYANEAPYGYRDSETGKVTGESPEIARAILHRMGVTKIVPVLVEFGSLIPGLKAGRFDIVAAGMYITPQRSKEIAFSNPTYKIHDAFMVKKGNPLHIHGYGDVVKNGKARLGVMKGSVELTYAKTLGVPKDRIVQFPDYPSAVAGLQTGRIDALGATRPTVRYLLIRAKDAQLAMADPFEDPVIHGKKTLGYGGFGFRKSDRDFVKKFDAQLAKFIGTKAHLDLVRPFGFGTDTLPGDVTAKELSESR